MRALVTGATGFLGHHLCDKLIRRADLLVQVVRDFVDDWWVPEGSKIVLGGFDQVERALVEYEIDTVFHLAAQTQVSTAAKDPASTLETNVRGTWQVLEACRRQKVRRIIVASSDKAYGDGATPYFEHQDLRPHGIYATSKAAADLLAQSYAREFGMSVAITRCGNLYGPGHLNWTTLIPGTIRSIVRGEAPRLRSKGGAKRDYLYVDDAVDGYLKLVESAEIGPFNFGTGNASSVCKIVETISALMRSRKQPIYEDAEAPGAGGAELAEQFLSIEKAQKILGWKPQHSLELGLSKTIEWYRNYLEGRP